MPANRMQGHRKTVRTGGFQIAVYETKDLELRNNTVWDVTLINSQTVERLERKAVDLAQRVVGFKMFDLHDGLTPDDRYMS